MREEGVAVFDKTARKTIFVRTPEDALNLRMGKKVEILGESQGVPDVVEKLRPGMRFSLDETPPSRFATTDHGREALDILSEAVEAGRELLTPTQIRDELKRRGINPASLPKGEKQQLLAGAALLQAQRGGIDLGAAEEVFLDSAARAKARRDPGTFYSQFFDGIHEKSKAAWAERGIEYHNKAQFLREVKDYQDNQQRREAPLRETLDRDFQKARKRDIQDLSDLTKGGLLGEKSVKKLQDAGITLADLRSGRVTEDRLKSLGGIGPEKVEAMRKLGFPIAGSVEVKRPVGRPPKALFGPGHDPFRDTTPGFFTSRRRLRSPTTGELELRPVKGVVRQALDSFKEGWRTTIGRPFAYLQQYRNDETRRVVREAKQLASLKRAASFKNRVEKSRSGLGATFWELIFQGQAAVRNALMLAIVVGGVLFIPFGIFQFAGWVIFGLGAFIVVGAYMMGLTAFNLLASGALNSIHTLGFLIQSSLQAFLNEVPKIIPGGGGILPTYVPITLNWQIAEALDPNLFFPDCVNTNTLGSIALRAAASALTAFAAWVGANGSFAVGVSIILFLGVPTYFMSRGTSIGFVLLGLLNIVASTFIQGVSMPLWAILIGVVGIGTAGLFGLARASEAGPFALVLGIGVAIAVVMGLVLVYETLKDVVNSGGFHWTRSIELSAQPVADALEGSVRALSDGLQWLAQQVTTGWAHVLDPSKLENIRNTLRLTDAPTQAEAAKCGG